MLDMTPLGWLGRKTSTQTIILHAMTIQISLCICTVLGFVIFCIKNFASLAIKNVPSEDWSDSAGWSESLLGA